MREGNIFSLFTLAGRGTTSQVWTGGVPHPRSEWGVPHPRSGWGVPHPAGLDGVPFPPSKTVWGTQRAVCLLRSRRRTFWLRYVFIYPRVVWCSGEMIGSPQYVRLRNNWLEIPYMDHVFMNMSAGFKLKYSLDMSCSLLVFLHLSNSVKWITFLLKIERFEYLICFHYFRIY